MAASPGWCCTDPGDGGALPSKMLIQYVNVDVDTVSDRLVSSWVTAQKFLVLKNTRLSASQIKTFQNINNFISFKCYCGRWRRLLIACYAACGGLLIACYTAWGGLLIACPPVACSSPARSGLLISCPTACSGLLIVCPQWPANRLPAMAS